MNSRWYPGRCSHQTAPCCIALQKVLLWPYWRSSHQDRLDQRGIDSTTTDTVGSHLKVIIIDGMAELQSLDKPDWVKNCAQLAEHFVATIEQKYGRRDEVRLIFDRYDVSMSLKEATGEKKQGGQDAVYYRITDSTKISRVPMKKLLSHTKTKMELTNYLLDRAITHFSRQGGRRFVVAHGGECKAKPTKQSRRSRHKDHPSRC